MVDFKWRGTFQEVEQLIKNTNTCTGTHADYLCIRHQSQEMEILLLIFLYYSSYYSSCVIFDIESKMRVSCSTKNEQMKHTNRIEFVPLVPLCEIAIFK